MKRFLSLLVAVFVAFQIGAFAETANSGITLTSPQTRIVFQRNSANKAVIPISGTCSVESTKIEVRLLALTEKSGRGTSWTALKSPPKKGAFSGKLTAQGGWYDLEIRAFAGKTKVAEGKLERVGVGEVFVIVGHSVAQGGGDTNEPAKDDRVSVVALDEESPSFTEYKKTADPKLLPDLSFVQYGEKIKPAPFGHGTYFWARFGDYVAKDQNVPVLLYNAAFGGTSLEHWSKSSQGIQFEHGFVRAPIRMPYINLYNTLKKYIPATGIRALLADQGQNDAGQPSAEIVLGYYEQFVKQAREDFGYPQLAVVVNRQTPGIPDNPSKQIREAQERMIKTPFCFPGPDYDKLLPEDRPDKIHLGPLGEAKAARMWAEALDQNFYKTSKPWLPAFQ